jgi:peptide/nickel transport system substrate-binding protein
MTAEPHHLSRRALLGSAAVGAGGLALIGCGGGGSDDSSNRRSSADASEGSPRPTKRGGTFRLGLSDSSSADSLEVRDSSASYTNIFRTQALYDSLLEWNQSKQRLDHRLADAFEPAKDLSYWDVRLKDAEFHNGKPVTADDLIFSIKRHLNPKVYSTVSGAMTTIDAKRLKKMDPKTVRIYLTTPDISVPNAFALPGTGVIPVDFDNDPKHPIGSGPFKFKSFTPGRQSVFVRNDNYFISGEPFLDELIMIGFADPGTTRINALTSGQIDGADHLPLTLVRTLEADQKMRVLLSGAYSYVTWNMRMGIEPFKDERVRQAMMLLADRQQIVDQAYGGKRFAQVANDLASKQDPLYNKDIPQRTQDIEQAKSLLKQAGQSDLRVELAVTSGAAPGLVETAQVLQQQAKAAGVKIKVNTIADIATYYAKYNMQAPFKFSYYGTFALFDHIGFSLLPNSPYNTTDFKDPEFVKLVQEGRGTADDAKRKEIMGEAQRILWERGTQGIFAYYASPDAYNKKFTGVQSDIWAWGPNHGNFQRIGLA